MKGSEKKDKNIFKNYILLAVIFLICCGVTLYLCRLYTVYREYEREIPVIRDSLLEITYDDLEHYVMDNPSSVIYMCTASDDKCRSYEKDFKKLIEKEELHDSIIYLNLSNMELDEFVNNFNSKYKSKRELTTNYPAFVIFEDGKVVEMLQGKKNAGLSISRTKNFLELNGVSEEE